MCGRCPDDFIGQTFPTPKGGVLTVVGHNGLKGNKKKYKLTCSICSLDTELFPDLFESVKSSLVKGQYPCGCSHRNRLNEQQLALKISRMTKDENYRFVEFINGFKGIYSKFKYICPKHGIKISSYDNYSRGKRCNECGNHRAREKHLKTDPDVVIRDLCNSLGYKFINFNKKYNGIRSKFSFICPKHGIQESRYTFFVHNSRGCRRCGVEPNIEKSRTKNPEEKIKSLCDIEKYKFIGFCDGFYKNIYSKFEYNCHTHGKQTVSYGSFVKDGKRCPSCANYGYQPDKPGFLYVTNWNNSKKDTNEFFKIGISNDYTRRIKEQARKTSYKPHQIIVFKFEDGSIPQELERLTKPYRQDMEHPIITPDEFADGTTEILQNWIDIIKILPELIDTIREKGYTPEIEVGKRLYNKLIKLDKDQMVKVILDHLYK